VPNRTPTEYYRDHKERLNQKGRQYYQDNAEQIKQYIKQYRADNKDKIKEQKSQKHDCPGGGKYQNTTRARHFKTKKHRKYGVQSLHMEPFSIL
jgi:hypothetical protein